MPARFIFSGITAAVLLAGCASAPQSLSSMARDVRVAKSDPPPGYIEVANITGVDGSGCGLVGSRGTYEGAMNDLKNKAAGYQADFVQIFTITEPHVRPACFDNKYTISGTAYQKGEEQVAPKQQPQSAPGSLEEKLAKLKKLKDDGLITDGEYIAQKARVLESGI